MRAYEEQLESIVKRFVPQENGCWYLGTRYYSGITKPDSKGYSNTKIGYPNHKSIRVHKLSWMYYKGDIPEGMVVDHMCHDPKTCQGGSACEHRQCVNPNHLQLLSGSDNSKKTVRVLEYRTHCKWRHKLENNIYEFNSKQGKRRACATCANRPAKVGI